MQRKRLGGSRLIARLTIALIVTVLATAGVSPVSSAHARKTSARSAKKNGSPHGSDRIAAFVGTVQPKKGPKFARRVARAIRRSASATGISPEVILATGYVESEFRMSSGPCIGLMQVHPGTLREMRKRVPASRGLNPRRLEDNIRLGAIELASHYKKSPSGTGKTARLRRALGRYNGAGANSGYVRRVSTVLRRIRKGDADDWQRHLEKRGPLWRA